MAPIRIQSSEIIIIKKVQWAINKENCAKIEAKINPGGRGRVVFEKKLFIPQAPSLTKLFEKKIEKNSLICTIFGF